MSESRASTLFAWVRQFAAVWGFALFLLFVVIVFGGLGSLPGAFIASLLIGLIQTFAVALNGSLASAFGPLDPSLGPSVLTDIWNVTIAQIAPILPYVLLVLILIVRPMGLLGTRET